MVFQQKLLEKAYFTVKITGPAMVRLGSFSNLGCLDAPVVLPTIAVADPGEGRGGARPPSPLSQGLDPALYWVGACMETEPMVPPASSDFWKVS